MKLDNLWTREQLRRKHEKLASQIGIPYEDLIKTKWEIENHKNEDDFIHSYTIRFNDSPKEILQKIPNLKNNEVWISLFVDCDEDFVDYQDEEKIISNKPFYLNFYNGIFQLRQLNSLYMDEAGLMEAHKKQLYISAIGVLETFLSDTFIFLIEDNEIHLQNFMKSYPLFVEKKISLGSIFEEFDNIKKTAKTELLNIVYHNLGRIKPMYESTFKIDFPDIKKLAKAVNIRHDLVHRNGKDKNNLKIKIHEENIEELLIEIVSFVNELCVKLKVDEFEFNEEKPAGNNA